MKTLTHILMQKHLVEVPLPDAKQARATWRAMNGFAEQFQPLLTPPHANPKFEHTTEVAVYGMSLLPANSHGSVNACPWSTPECRKGCLAFAGRGKCSNTEAARRARTDLWLYNPLSAYTLLCHEIREARAKHGAEGMAVRLNVLSDVEWERVLPPEFWYGFADVQFYDYTKSLARAIEAMRCEPREWYRNYHLTYSISERDALDDVEFCVNNRIPCTVVVPLGKSDPKPDTWFGMPVTDGDASDARYTDKAGTVTLLHWKGSLVGGPVGWDHFVKPLG